MKPANGEFRNINTGSKIKSNSNLIEIETVQSLQIIKLLHSCLCRWSDPVGQDWTEVQSLSRICGARGTAHIRGSACKRK